jgi:hypothetical protein
MDFCANLPDELNLIVFELLKYKDLFKSLLVDYDWILIDGDSNRFEIKIHR